MRGALNNLFFLLVLRHISIENDLGHRGKQPDMEGESTLGEYYQEYGRVWLNHRDT